MTKNEDDKNQIRFRKQNVWVHNSRVKGKKRNYKNHLLTQFLICFKQEYVDESSHEDENIEVNVETNKAIDENESTEANMS